MYTVELVGFLFLNMVANYNAIVFLILKLANTIFFFLIALGIFRSIDIYENPILLKKKLIQEEA